MGVTISDLLKKGGFQSITHEIEIGNVYKINMTKEDGVCISNNTSSISKYFVVVGFDDKGIAYGGILISSNLPRKAYNQIEYFYPVKASDNDFLKYDSHIDCTRIFQSSPSKLTFDTHIGYLDEQSLHCTTKMIMDEKNPTLTDAERKLYNIEIYGNGGADEE